MTLEHINKFFTLLMGGCWHDQERVCYGEFDPTFMYLRCSKCNTNDTRNPDHLSNPTLVLKWMREHMPEELEKYFDWACEDEKAPCLTWYIFSALDLRNLYQYLIDNPSWGEKECEQCKGKGNWIQKGWDLTMATQFCFVCNGTGKIIHPALAWARGGKG